jgi:hypothetical protein
MRHMRGMPIGAPAGRMRDLSAAGFPEVALPLVVAILLGVFWLGVLVTVGFTAWRLLANLKALARSLSDLSERLAPTLQELETKAQQTAELGERLQRRQAARQATGRQRGGRRRGATR